MGRRAVALEELTSGAEGGATRSFIGSALLGLGRLLLIGTVPAVVLCRQTRGSWQTAPLDESGIPDHWIPQTTLFITFFCAFALPFLLLPLGSAAGATNEGSQVRVRTVLGRRCVREPLTISSVVLPGRLHGLGVHFLKARNRQFVIVTSSGLWSGDSALGTPGGWLLLLGWLSAGILAWMLLTFAAGVF